MVCSFLGPINLVTSSWLSKSSNIYTNPCVSKWRSYVVNYEVRNFICDPQNVKSFGKKPQKNRKFVVFCKFLSKLVNPCESQIEFQTPYFD